MEILKTIAESILTVAALCVALAMPFCLYLLALVGWDFMASRRKERRKQNGKK